MTKNRDRDHAARAHAMQLAVDNAARNGVRDLRAILKDAKKIKRFLRG